MAENINSADIEIECSKLIILNVHFLLLILKRTSEVELIPCLTDTEVKVLKDVTFMHAC